MIGKSSAINTIYVKQVNIQSDKNESDSVPLIFIVNSSNECIHYQYVIQYINNNNKLSDMMRRGIAVVVRLHWHFSHGLQRKLLFCIKNLAKI